MSRSMTTGLFNGQHYLAAGALELGVTLSTQQLDQLVNFRDLIVKWNRVHNLTAVRDPSEMLVTHLLDSLSLLPHLTACERIADVGSGAGLPSIVLAIARPDLQVYSVESIAKKATFQTTVRAALGLANLHVMNQRAEDVALQNMDVVTSRAFSSLADFVRLTRGWLGVKGCWLAMKGVIPLDELNQLPANIEFIRSISLKVPHLNAERHLIELRQRVLG